MTDGTDALDSELRDALGATDVETVEQADGTQQAAEAEVTDTPAGDPTPDASPDLSIYPEDLRTDLSGLPPETLTKLVEAHKGFQADHTRKTQAAAQAQKEAKAVMEKAQWADGVQGNEALMQRMFGLQPETTAEPDKSLLEMEEPELKAAIRRMAQAEAAAIVKEQLTNSPVAKQHAVRTAEQNYWQQRQSAGEQDSQQLRKATIDSFVSQCQQNNMGLDQIPPDSLPFLLEPHIQIAKLSLQAAQKSNSATQAGSKAASVSASGATAPVRGLKAWQREKRKATDDEIWNDADTGSPDLLERLARGEKLPK